MFNLKMKKLRKELLDEAYAMHASLPSKDDITYTEKYAEYIAKLNEVKDLDNHISKNSCSKDTKVKVVAGIAAFGAMMAYEKSDVIRHSKVYQMAISMLPKWK